MGARRRALWVASVHRAASRSLTTFSSSNTHRLSGCVVASSTMPSRVCLGRGGPSLRSTQTAQSTPRPSTCTPRQAAGRRVNLTDGRKVTALSYELRSYIAAKDTEAHKPLHPADTKKPSPQLAQLPTASTRDWRGASQEDIQEPSQEGINRWFVEEYLPAQEAKEAEEDDKRWAEVEEKKAKQPYDHSQWAHFDEEWARVNNRQLWRQCSRSGRPPTPRWPPWCGRSGRAHPPFDCEGRHKGGRGEREGG
ncbi:unnamed protein product [Vitrella brassicaformis CCMP3155]|uniref:Uncharacterized protein n=2 Tax=Vitrella brassicaformis TaxID=1169539 RepID=A0A0G4FWM2_VITBC|nr:unnamed protein product [Vitrella brassicaformis CCMP3155]|eukprot:CEM19624.1 unnamed protein product [Vitrella brassicaformis CCMP3155]